eukprot:15462452-Alexandrium_andersonii.AAC.1
MGGHGNIGNGALKLDDVADSLLQAQASSGASTSSGGGFLQSDTQIPDITALGLKQQEGKGSRTKRRSGARTMRTTLVPRAPTRMPRRSAPPGASAKSKSGKGSATSGWRTRIRS